MATMTQFKSNLPPQLQGNILKIPSTSSVQVSKPDLDDDKKRWLVVGICLHTVVSPVLRQYVDPIINSLYTSLKQGHSIDRQTYPNHLTKYPPTKKNLNYEAINNNNNIPWLRGNKDLAKYDYNVLNAVDLSKLFMDTHMAQYTGFDATCDSSALLGLLINIDKFPLHVQAVAKRIRTDIRNPWAHCNFTEWNSIKYLDSFQTMNQMIKNLNLTTADENRTIGELSRWETNGIHFLQGTTIGLDLLEEVRDKIQDLAKYSLAVTDETDKCFTGVKTELEKIQNVITIVIDRVNMIENNQENFERALEDVESSVETLYAKSTECENQQRTYSQKLESTSIQLQETVVKIDDLKEHHGVLAGEVFNLQNEQSRTKQNIQEIREDVNKLTIDFESFKYTSYVRPEGKVYFYPPYRIKCFVGRVHDLKVLESSFVNHIAEKHTHAICGLGGCGKTTLAIEYAWTYQELYPGGIFWMSAESHEALETSVSNLAIDINTVGRTSKETFNKTFKWIGSLSEKWLLVVDNVDGDDISGNIEELLLGIWQRNASGHILITSRREPEEVEESFKIEKEHCLYLEILSKHEGTLFLKKRTDTDTDDENDTISTLVHELGGLPLALEQAGAYIKIKKSSFSEYMERFKKKRLQLLNASVAKSVVTNIRKERLAVKTTWQMNIEYIKKQSEQEGMGSAALTMMEITSFLFADDIPVEIINNGTPAVEDEDLQDTLQDSFGIKQVTEILTRFSLFQRYGENTLAVHRLVQEVIRESLNEPNRKMFILQSATRMINKALKSATSPYDVVCVGSNVNFRRGALYLWSKLAANASALKTHVLEFSKNSVSGNSLCINLETMKMLQTTAIFNSVHQRQDEALADQKQMLHLMTNLNLEAESCHEYTALKVPLLEEERSKIQNCLSAVLLSASDVRENAALDASQSNESEILRIAGNTAYKEKKFQNAIQYYTEGIRACADKNIDHRLLSNRSLLYLKIGDYKNALKDAEKCIVLAPNNWKGYCWKAYAIANLVKKGELPPSMETVGLASACIAANMNEECLIEYKMKIYYPVVVYKVIEPNDNLADEIGSIFQRPFTTLLLRKGLYVIKEPVVTTKSMQLIGIEEGVEIDMLYCLPLLPPQSSDYRIPYQPERNIHIHFENIFFVTGSGQISICTNAMATFYKCKFSNGGKGCDDFPKCNGGSGCANQSRCTRPAELSLSSGMYTSGLCGYPGVVACSGGKAYLNNCVLDRCGGGGVLSDGEKSYLEIRNCTVQNMRQTGVEARNGGKIVVENNVIMKNQFHGVAIVPRGFGVVRKNMINQNGQEGIFCGGILDPISQWKMNSEGASKASIIDNIISQNGKSGISLDGGTFEVSGNKIMNNWLWGMMIKSRSATYVLANDIFENKCGGIRMGVNYSASVIIDGNTIRDHTGPDVFVLNSTEHFMKDQNIANVFKSASSVVDLGGETSMYSLPPVITNRNISRNNNKGIQHPRDVVQLIQVCASCFRSSKNLKRCAKCKTATYCSKECQTEQWQRHKHMCKILHKEYTIQIQMKNTLPFQKPGTLRNFEPSLIGIKEGPPPDPTSQKSFIVKVQSGEEYSKYNPSKLLVLYDRSVTLDIKFSCPELYHLVNECGVLSAKMLTTKKIFCWASFKENGKVLCIHTDSLPPFQTW